MAAPTADEILELYDELNFPNAPKLRAALLKKGFRARIKDVEAFVKAQTPTQLFAKGPKYRGHIISSRVNERWAIDFIDLHAEPDGDLKYILMAQDIHSRKIWAKALAEKKPADYIAAFKDIIREGGKPKEVNFDGEFDVPQFIRFLSSGGVAHRVSQNRQDLGVLDASMGALKKDLKKDMQVQSTDKWGERLDKVVRGVNNQSRQALLGGEANTVHYRPGQEAPKDTALEFELREHAGRQMAAQDAQVKLAQKNVEATGKFREYIGRDDRRKRGDRPTFSGEVITLQSVRGNRATDTQGKEHSLTTVKPVDRDARTEPIAVRLRGSAQTDARHRESLNPYAEQLREYISNRGGARLTLGEAAAWLKTGGRKAQFEAAMRGVRSFSAFLKLFPEIFELDIPAAGGTTRVRLA